MANEITVTTGLGIVKGSLNRNIPVRTFQADMAGVRVITNTQSVATVHEALEVGDLASAGYCTITNLDGTNYAELGVDVAGTFYPVVRVDAGKSAGPFRLSSLTRHVQANTAAVNLDITIAEA